MKGLVQTRIAAIIALARRARSAVVVIAAATARAAIVSIYATFAGATAAANRGQCRE